MTSRSVIFNSVYHIIMLSLVLTSAGCILQPKGAAQHSVRGSWTGRAIPVTVTDLRGVRHEALEFHVINGPSWARNGVARVGEELPHVMSRPLLLRSDRRIVAPEGFRDRTLRVRGVMMSQPAYDPARQAHVSRMFDGDNLAMEFAIRLRGEPEILYGSDLNLARRSAHVR